VVANSSPRQTHERRVLQGRVFRFLRRDFEGWARAGGHRVSRSLNRRVTRTPRWATRWAESLSGSLRGRVPG
jgi:hypothetical protein